MSGNGAATGAGSSYTSRLSRKPGACRRQVQAQSEYPVPVAQVHGLTKGGRCAGCRPRASEEASEQARGRGTHAHEPIGSDHMLQSRGSEVARRQRKFPPATCITRFIANQLSMNNSYHQ